MGSTSSQRQPEPASRWLCKIDLDPQQSGRYSRNPSYVQPVRWTHFYFWWFFRKSQKRSFPEIFFLGPGDIPLFGKIIKYKNASGVAHRTGYGNNAQSQCFICQHSCTVHAGIRWSGLYINYLFGWCTNVHVHQKTLENSCTMYMYNHIQWFQLMYICFRQFLAMYMTKRRFSVELKWQKLISIWVFGAKKLCLGVSKFSG